MVNLITTYELGYKANTELFDTIATLFLVGTSDANSEGTKGGGETAVIGEYTSFGLEWELNFGISIWDWRNSLTYISPEITEAPTNKVAEGKVPRRQAPIYMAMIHQFAFGSSGLAARGSAGFTLIHSAAAYSQDANGWEMPAYMLMNVFAGGYATDDFYVGLDINNALDTVAITEAEENMPFTLNGVEYVRARTVAGRTVGLNIRYEF